MFKRSTEPKFGINQQLGIFTITSMPGSTSTISKSDGSGHTGNIGSTGGISHTGSTRKVANGIDNISGVPSLSSGHLNIPMTPDAFQQGVEKTSLNTHLHALQSIGGVSITSSSSGPGTGTSPVSGTTIATTTMIGIGKVGVVNPITSKTVSKTIV